MRVIDHDERAVAVGEGADLCSTRPFHPARFHDELPTLGDGPRRSRGCFWLPTRPDDVCVWDGAGGRVSIGPAGRWGRNPDRLSRIVVTGLDDDHDERARLQGAFSRCLLTDQEMERRKQFQDESWDGFEAWLGPIERAA